MGTRKDHRPDKPRCGHCLHPGFTKFSYPWTDKPFFKCDRCGSEWSCGKDGGKYDGHEMNR